MSRLHIKYREDGFDERLVILTERFVSMKPWPTRHAHAHNERMYGTWAHGANMIYGLPEVQVVINHKPVEGAVGRYVPAEGDALAIIALNRFSVVSLFHQYRHHMQAHVENLPYEGGDEEAAQDAQAWACSLFYLLRPKTFRRAVRNGRIAGVYPPDLLKRRRSS